MENTVNCDLMIIGAGMAGMSAALFAANKGISTVQVGASSELIYSSGLFDLCGVNPENNKIVDDPFKGIDELINREPDHPYSRLKKSEIVKALSEFSDFFSENLITYKHNNEKNSEIITSIGTTKPSYLIPETMWNGCLALRDKAPCLFIDFHGLKGYSANQITSVLKSKWGNIRYQRIKCPSVNIKGEIFPEQIARSLELKKEREKLVDAIKPFIKDAEYIGLPAIFGLYRIKEIFHDLEKLTGVKIFEIPTMPPCATGIRIKETFERKLQEKGVKTFYKRKVKSFEHLKDDSFIVDIGKEKPDYSVKTKKIVLCSGRFIGKGLTSDRVKIREAIFNLPVFQPESRSSWHSKKFFDPKGHEINSSGVMIDKNMRPVDFKGQPVYENLYAAGSILAHNDWKKIKSGSGVAITSAYAAINSLDL